MPVSRGELAARLRYPAVWIEKELYTEELYRHQLAAFVADAHARALAPAAYHPRGGTEHYRYGAFRYWVARDLSPEALHALLEAAVADPDPAMAGAAIKDLLAAHRPTHAMLELALGAVRRSKRYMLSAEALQAWLRDLE